MIGFFLVSVFFFVYRDCRYGEDLDFWDDLGIICALSLEF